MAWSWIAIRAERCEQLRAGVQKALGLQGKVSSCLTNLLGQTFQEFSVSHSMGQQCALNAQKKRSCEWDAKFARSCDAKSAMRRTSAIRDVNHVVLMRPKQSICAARCASHESEGEKPPKIRKKSSQEQSSWELLALLPLKRQRK